MPEPIRFLVDYRGVLTDEEFYQAGAVAILPQAPALVDAGRAVWLGVNGLGPGPEPLPPNPTQPEPVLAVDLDDLSRSKLRVMAKAAGVKGYSRKTKPQLIAELRDD